MQIAKISLKKILIIILCVLLTSLVLKRDKVIKFFKEEKYYNSLVRLHLLKKCYNPSYDFEQVFVQEGLNYQLLNEQVINDSLKKLSKQNSTSSTDSKIPNITHKIYFTANNNVNLAEFYLEELEINYGKLNQLSDWQHNIWTNKQTIIPEDIRKIKGVNVRYIEEFEDHLLYQILVNLIDKGQEKKAYLAQASDLLRLLVMQKIGGFYSDIDYEIYHPQELLKLMNSHDFIGGREHFGINSYYGNSFIMTKPNHPIMNEAVNLSIRNYTNSLASLPKYLQFPCSDFETLYFNGPPLITISYFKKNNLDGNNDIILPPWMIYNVSFIRYKNQTCKINKIKDNFLQQQNLVIENLLNNFIEKPKIIDAHQKDLLTSGKLFDNIFYSLKFHKLYPIIGADMFCGSWTENRRTSGKNYYWNIPTWK